MILAVQHQTGGDDSVQHRRPSASDNFTVDTRDFNWRKIPISNNVGGVKMFSGTLRHPLRAERHFALVEICQANLGLASNRCGSGTQSDPTISSIATSIMITTSNSPVKGSGMPNHYGGDLLHTMAISGRSRVRTELLHFVVVPAVPPHPVQLDR